MQLKTWPLKNLVPFLTTCTDKASISKAHALMISSGIFRRGTYNAHLITSYVRAGHIGLARKLFDLLPKRGVDSWNAMIIAYSRGDCPMEVINLYDQMGSEGVKPDSSTFTVAIKACTSLLNLDKGVEIWRKGIDHGYERDVFVGSSVLNLYARSGRMDEAMRVFEKMAKRDVVCWTTMIMGFAKSGRVREAMDMYRQMIKGGVVEGNQVVMLGLIQACANVGDVRIGCSVHGYMIRRGLLMDVVVQTSLIDMYSKNGEIELAYRVFRSMGSRTVVSWSALIFGYAQNGLTGNALELLVEMQTFGFEPDSAALVGALLACSQVGFAKLGRSIHGFIERRFDMDHILGTSLIDMYAKCGSISCARVLFDRTRTRDLICWNSIISSYGIHGYGKEALSLFSEMIESNIEPDDATFAALLSALSHSGLVEEGQHWFDIMINKFNIKPSEKHYACLVDLLARAGRVEEAQNLINSMADEPGLAVWVALLSGCHNHKKFITGELAAKRVLELNPDSTGVYALVANFFAATRKWNEVARVRMEMKKSGMKKVPGYSVVEVNGDLHAFLMEDKSHPQHEQINQALQKLEHEMMAMGYVPRTEFVLHNVEEEVKVKMLCNHSERLAIAFGLLNTRPGTRLLITKNLRVCGDCHQAIKFISLIVKREIVVRDAKRFHHFGGGVCSCGDYW